MFWLGSDTIATTGDTNRWSVDTIRTTADLTMIQMQPTTKDSATRMTNGTINFLIIILYFGK